MARLEKTRKTQPDSKPSRFAGLFGVDLDEEFIAKATDDRTFIPLTQITLPTNQPRRFFDPARMAHLVESVRAHGILENLLVRPIGSDLFELVAGERRYRAAKEVGLTEVPVTIREMTEQQAIEIALVENLQREDLNPVEETEGILYLLATRLSQSNQKVIALLNRKKNEDSLNRNNVIPSPEWAIVQEVFDVVGRFTPDSFRANRLPLLNLPADILAVLRQGQIEYTKARAIARIKDTDERAELLKNAIEQGWTLSEIRAQIKALEPQPLQAALPDRLAETYQRLKRAKPWDNPKKAKQIEKLLAEMESLLS